MCVFVIVCVCVCVCNCIGVCKCLYICKFVFVCVFVFEVLIKFSKLWLKCLTFKREEDKGSSVIILVYKNEQKERFRKKQFRTTGWIWEWNVVMSFDYFVIKKRSNFYTK